MNAPATDAALDPQLPEAYQQKLASLVNAHRAFQTGEFEACKQQLLEIVSHITPQQADHTDLRSLLLFADAHQHTGHFESAYKNYVTALQLDSDLEQEVMPSLLNCLPNLKQPIDADVFVQHVVTFLEHPNYDSAAIDRLVVKMLGKQFELDDPEANIEFADIIKHPLLIVALNQLTLAGPEIETFLCQLRTLVFTNMLENGLLEPLLPIALAMAHHAERIEHVYFVSEAEREVLNGIEVLFQQNDESSVLEVANILLAYSLYEPLRNLTIAQRIAETARSTWPPLLKELFELTIYDHAEEAQLAADIPTFAIIDDTSKRVKAQYEENPYPRWRNIYRSPRNLQYLDLFPRLQTKIRKPKAFKKQISCLVAGCGTGRQPIWLANNVQHLQITAIDLSRASLAYATRMARKLETPKVDFMCLDLLHSDHIGKKFDVIECSGVLHHMEDPEAGLEALQSVLKPHGLLHLALYSRPAREALGVNTVRTQVAEQSINSDIESIRAVRHQILTSEDEFALKIVDFFSTSECRDLLFHVQEHQFDLIEVKALLKRHQLEFLGFSGLKSDVLAIYRERFSEDVEMLNLDNWAQLEREFPRIFQAMYQFHCQKVDPNLNRI